MEESGAQEKQSTARRKSIQKNSDSPTPEEPPSSINGKEQEMIQDKEAEGEKDDKTEANECSDAKAAGESKETSEHSKTGRKRKASEMKSDDGIFDEPPVKEKPQVQDKLSEHEKTSTDSEMETDDLRGIEESLRSESVNASWDQTFGKGKRARIPNKRYSDFPLTPSRVKSNITEHIDQVHNGEAKENIESESGSTSDLSGSKSSHTSSPAGSVYKKTKAPVNLNNPDFLKPFQYGWKRELVYRATTDNLNKRNGDIYYYTPSEPLGLNDPEKETIRDAKVKSGSEKKFVAASSRTTKSSGTSSPAVSSPVLPTSITETKEPTAALEAPKITEPATPKQKKNVAANLKVKLTPSKSKAAKAKPKKKEEELQMGTLPPTWQSPPKKSPTKATSDMDKRCQPCSIRCEGVSGPIPNLQCRICLCLYHNECVGLSPHVAIADYVCKNCQLGPDESSASASAVGPPPPPPPPPLTPVNTIKTLSVAATASLPKLQRIPKPNELTTSVNVSLKPPPLKPAPTNISDPIPSSDLPKLTPRPGIISSIVQNSAKTPDTVPISESKSIVGSVTTWFPPSSTIQVSQSLDNVENANATPPPPPRPQFVEYFGNKKYLVIPKHNVVNVSPTIAATATTPSSRPANVDSCEGGVVGFSDTEKTATEASSGAETAPTAVTPGGANMENLDAVIKSEPMSPISSESVTNLTDLNQLNLCSDTKIPCDTPPSQVIHEDNGTNADVEIKRDNGENEAESEAAENKRSSKRLAKSAQQQKFDTTKSPEKQFMDNFLQNLSFGYKTLLCVFQYLKMQDLLRASCVCKMWRDIASHPSLWHTVRMKNSQIHSFEGLADALQIHGTVHLDLRKMLLPGNGDEIWPEFSRAIKKVETLRKIELCRCPATVVEQLALSNPKLEVINAVTIKCESMGLAPLVYLKCLQELRLKSTAGFSLTSDLTALSDLKQLKHLSLTSIKDLNKLNIDVIADLSNLVSLELGECSDFPKSFGHDILSRLHKLEKLRLEKGQGNCHTFDILDAVKGMPQMEQLELVNFDIKPGFDKALGACTNIKKLLIIPTYISQSATTNHMVLGGVLRLRNTLLHFVWGVTLELLRVTELFVDQCEDPDKKEKKEKRSVGNGDSIPVLKPVPLLKEGQTTLDIPPAQDPPQVEILPLPNLQKLLLQSLPTTRVKILKIPFHATWRQSITDTVN
ncbi:proteoglycan 4 isoform X2 [Agrilus planipennis]|uniref:Proteoglycan 4 isoform X2 n=1 Tax=Agrilus planipennis TaxID=224129 RepID=A0A1W4WLA6_AGRPL|nr:proteoglycan 4 isoform X2 [Agrilus planipennis]